MDKNALPHSFKLDNLVWYEDFTSLGKNPKLTPKWSGPAKITEVNDTNARILLPNSKSKVLNVMRLKKFFSDNKSESSHSDKSDEENLDFNSEQNISRPMMLRKCLNDYTRTILKSTLKNVTSETKKCLTLVLH